MALSFPSNPNTNDTYTENNITYKWDGEKWVVTSSASFEMSGADIKVAYEGEADTNAFTDSDETKLDGIETAATADQTGGEIKAAYEAEADTNAFTDAEKSKLLSVELNAAADQTGAEIKALYEAEADTNAFTDAQVTKLAGIAAGAQVNVGLDGVTALDSNSTNDITLGTDKITLNASNGQANFEGDVTIHGDAQLNEEGVKIQSGLITTCQEFGANSVFRAITEAGGDYTIDFTASGNATFAGNVGIGTATPAGALHVDAASGVDGPVFDSGGTANTNHALLVRDSGNNQLLRVNNDGNVGIGTDSPNADLHVKGPNFVTLNLETTGVSTNQLLFTRSNGGPATTEAIVGHAAGNSDFYLQNELSGALLFGTNATERISINSAGNISNNGDNYFTFGPNSTWAKYLRIGGNGYQGDASTANIATTNGNLHIDAATDTRTYLNFYAGTLGVAFGNGSQGTVAVMGPDGDLWKGGDDNTGSKYWHAGNDGSGSGLDADTVDSIQASSFLRSDANDVTGTNVKTAFGGEITAGSSAVIQVNGFSRMGAIGMHRAADPTAGNGAPGADNEWLTNTDGNLRWGPNASSADGKVWHSNNDGSGSGLDADNLDGFTWASSGKNLRGTEIYADNWFRNYNNNEGLYNEANETYWYSTGTNEWNIRSNTTSTRIRFSTANNAQRAYIYADTSPSIGFLNSGGQWGLRYISLDSYSPNLYFKEEGNETWTGNPGNDEGKIEYHSNRFYIVAGANSTEIVKFRRSGTDRGTIDNDGNLTMSGNVTAYSDITLKENIEVIPNALDKVSSIRGVTYDRIDNEDLPRQAGVIAQEVEVVLPEVVNTDENGIKSVAYGNMVGLLIESIKELKTQNEVLNNRISQLEAKS